MDNMEKLQKYDAAYGIVTSHSSKCAYVQLENGELAICYTAGNIPNNRRIICSVRRPATDERRCIVNLDSVCNCYDYDIA